MEKSEDKNPEESGGGGKNLRELIGNIQNADLVIDPVADKTTT